MMSDMLSSALSPKGQIPFKSARLPSGTLKLSIPLERIGDSLRQGNILVGATLSIGLAGETTIPVCKVLLCEIEVIHPADDREAMVLIKGIVTTQEGH